MAADKITFGSLFAGIGGLDLGLERAGMRCLWQVELDDYANKVLAKHWPDVDRYRDVRDCGTGTLAPVDLICGGFPCQDVSLAGKRAGLEGKRTTLWSEFARIVRELEPRWVLAENVPGLLSSDDGRFFGQVLGDLAACGYDAEWDCIPAAAIGAPHRRDRVFVVAYACDLRCDTGRSEQPLQGVGQCGQSWPHWDDVPHAHGRQQGRRVFTQREPDQRNADVAGHGTEVDVANATGQGIYGVLGNARGAGAPSIWAHQQERSQPSGSGWWSVEPDVGRVADGVPSRVDRLKCLGNAVVPQVAEWIGRRIVEAAYE